MKALHIVESAYRATLEEQDDTVLWLTQAMRGAGGAAIDVVLRGNAVNYAVPGQDASGLAFGRWQQTQPPRIEHDLRTLVAKGAIVYALDEDLAERGLGGAELVEGVRRLRMPQLAALMAGCDRVWHW